MGQTQMSPQPKEMVHGEGGLATIEEDWHCDTDEDDFESADALDAVDEAWNRFRKTGELTFSETCFDTSAITSLYQKCMALQTSDLPQQNGSSPATFSSNKKKFVTRSITRIEMEACNFLDAPAAQYWIWYLQMLGPALQELFIIGIPNQFLNGERAIAILCGVQNVTFLKRLAVDRVDLRGRNMGHILQNFLESKSNKELVELRFNHCQVDNLMYVPFLNGLKNRPTGLQRLDLDGWELNTVELELLVDALIHSSSQATLKGLDLSNSRMGHLAFGTLAKLLSKMTCLEELNLCACFNLLEQDASVTAGFQEFVQQLKSNKSLKELWLCECHILQPMAALMLQALQENSSLEVLNVEGMLVLEDDRKHQKYAKPRIRETIIP
eukprot:CAMPEP_0198138826 /NCGR_PEP_ID=MMETSP1443-20131203/2219_1 /TAXON_ID=186043 /ORGANISM="Entomoneis sp., Strain CCMP2396" /LENGTH=382 /DNA_ID=CAMNT_0043800765 /DNA_START=158 /DNA_END=1303 /DNA_ORIENTATION=-